MLGITEQNGKGRYLEMRLEVMVGNRDFPVIPETISNQLLSLPLPKLLSDHSRGRGLERVINNCLLLHKTQREVMDFILPEQW